MTISVQRRTTATIRFFEEKNGVGLTVAVEGDAPPRVAISSLARDSELVIDLPCDALRALCAATLKELDLLVPGASNTNAGQQGEQPVRVAAGKPKRPLDEYPPTPVMIRDLKVIDQFRHDHKRRISVKELADLTNTTENSARRRIHLMAERRLVSGNKEYVQVAPRGERAIGAAFRPSMKAEPETETGPVEDAATVPSHSDSEPPPSSEEPADSDRDVESQPSRGRLVDDDGDEDDEDDETSDEDEDDDAPHESDDDGDEDDEDDEAPRYRVVSKSDRVVGEFLNLTDANRALERSKIATHVVRISDGVKVSIKPRGR